MIPLYYRWTAAVSLVVGCLLPTAAPAKVAPTSIPELARAAEVIAMARVEAVPSFDGLPVARAVPDRVLKGKLAKGPIYFVAGPTWSCDTSGAIAGESVLLFLNRAKGERITRKGGKPPGAKVPVKPLYVLTHAGRGRLPERRVNGDVYFILPFDIEPPTGAEPTVEVGKERCLRGAEVLRAIGCANATYGWVGAR